MTPVETIIEAIKAGDQEKVGQLLKENPELAGARSAQGESAILMAVYRGRSEILEMVLAANPETDIFEASAAGQLGRVKSLAAADPASVNLFSRDGFTPLHSAAHNGQMEMVELLLNHGAGVHARSEEGLTPLRLALDRGHESVAERLRRQGAVE